MLEVVTVRNKWTFKYWQHEDVPCEKNYFVKIVCLDCLWNFYFVDKVFEEKNPVMVTIHLLSVYKLGNIF